MHKRGEPAYRMSALAIAVGTLLGVGGAVEAQESLDEIIVTAERRETSLQETPISVATFSAETMELKGLETLEDVANFTPNLDIKGSRGNGNISPTYQIRGLSGGGGATGERATAMYIDGIFMPRTTGPYMNVLDIERIEVLRGPQGTLFGRNSTGGAIRVFTKQPGPEQEAYIRLTGGDFSRADVSGMVNVPFSDSVFFRVQGGRLSQDGYVRRGTQELGGSEDTIGRIQLAIEPSDDLRFTIGLSSVDSESDGNPQDLATFDMAPDLNYEGNHADWISDFLQAAGQPRLTINDPRVVRDDFTLPDWCFLDDADPDWDPLCEQRNESNYRQLDFNATWQINDAWQFTSITGLSEFESRGIADWIMLSSQAIPSNVDSDVTYQEFQLNASLADGKLDLVTGLSYFQEDSASAGASWARQGTSVFFSQNPAGNGVAVGQGPNGLWETGDSALVQDSESYGLFANLTWSITDRLALTPGVRWASDEKRVVDTAFRSNGFTPAPGTESTTIRTQQDWDETDWRLTVDYRITDDIMVYGTSSKAFRAGAYNYTIPSWAPAPGPGGAGPNNTSDLLTAGLAAVPPFVPPESVQNDEIGFRTEWLDRRLRLNFTFFDMNYSDRQAAVAQTVPITQNPVGFIIVIQNSGDVALDGIELEGQFAASENFILDFSAGSLDSKLDNVCANNGDFLFPGPVEESYSVGGRWFKDMSSGAALTVSLNYGWTGKQQTHPGGVLDPVANGCAASTTWFYDSRYELPDYGLWNARVRYEPSNANWSLSVFANNLTDEVYANYASRFGGGFWDFTALAIPPLNPTTLAIATPQRSALGLTRGRPREVGVTFQYNFGERGAGSSR
jgi:iron complex outermembrane receptor protein